MPYKRSFRFRRRQRRPYRPRGRQVGPYLRRPRWNFRKRVAQNLTREVRSFKQVGTLQASVAGVIGASFDYSDLPTAKSFAAYATIWEEYKILSIDMRLFPSHVGSESLIDNNPPGGGPNDWTQIFVRGNIVSWIDPNSPSPTPPNSINDVFGKPSARLFNPRYHHRRWITRPRGYPAWGQIDNNGIIQTADPWPGTINLYGRGFSPPQLPGNQVFFYWLLTYKVLFRSRQDST